MPYLYFTKKVRRRLGTRCRTRQSVAFQLEDLIDVESETEAAVTQHITRRVSREFAGLDQADQPTTDALLNFSFFLTVGNMDEAFKAIKLIKRYRKIDDSRESA